MALQDVFPTAAHNARGRDRFGVKAAWLVLLLVAALGSSFTFECVTPFCAFAVLTAATFSRRGALIVTALVWAVNQGLGYGALGYPIDAHSLVWGGMIGVAALAATGATFATFTALRRLSPWHSIPVAFVAAVIAYEGILYLVSLAMGDSANFAPDIVAKVALSDACWLFGLVILRYWLVSFRPNSAIERRPVHS